MIDGFEKFKRRILTTHVSSELEQIQCVQIPTTVIIVFICEKKIAQINVYARFTSNIIAERSGGNPDTEKRLRFVERLEFMKTNCRYVWKNRRNKPAEFPASDCCKLSHGRFDEEACGEIRKRIDTAAAATTTTDYGVFNRVHSCDDRKKINNINRERTKRKNTSRARR